jgi:purine-binding chemotaxis protein CheW
VREIMRMQTITKVPGAMAYIEGVINLRGKVLPVLDLRKRLGLHIGDLTEESRIVVIDIATGEVGVIVDAVTEVLRVQNSAIEGPSSMLAQGNSDYLRGIAKLSDRLIILLDLNKLLSSKAESDAIAKLLTESVSNARDEDHEPVIALKNGNGKKKAVEASKGNNNKEPAVV